MIITNEKQYKITKSWIKKFEDSLFELKQLPQEKGREWVRQGQKEALELQIDELKAQLSEYEQVKSGKAKLPAPSVVADVLRSVAEDLIKWRIAKGLTQKSLGEKLGVAEQQIQKYEQTNYASANLETLVRVITVFEEEESAKPDLRLSKRWSRASTKAAPSTATRKANVNSKRRAR